MFTFHEDGTLDVRFPDVEEEYVGGGVYDSYVVVGEEIIIYDDEGNQEGVFKRNVIDDSMLEGSTCVLKRSK